MKIDWKTEIKLPKPRLPKGVAAGNVSWPSWLKFPRIFGPKLSRSSEAKVRRPSMGGPELRPPKFVADLYADLRDRRLLPLVALLIIAMVAAPILLSTGGHEEEIAVSPIAEATGAEADASFSVVPAGSGLHDYKRRLAHRKALNPFRAAPVAPTTSGEKKKGGSAESSGAGSQEAEGSEAATASEAATEPMTSITVGNVTKEVPAASVKSTDSGSTQDKSSGSKPKATRVTHTESTKTESTKVESGTSESSPSAPTESAITESTAPVETSETKGPVEPTHVETPPSKASSEASQPQPTQAPPSQIVGYTIDAEAGFVPNSTEKTELAPMTKLPNRQHPVVLYVGLSKDHKRALFLMTSQVTAYYGGNCALDKEACQLVEVKPGKGVTFAYGYGESRFKVHLKKIVPTLRFSK